MGTLLENFLENFEEDLYTIPGSRINYGYNRTQGFYPFSSKSAIEGFTAVWIVSGKGYMNENGQTYQVSDRNYCLRRPDREWEMAFCDEESIQFFFRLPKDLYPALCLIIPELNSLPPVGPVPDSDDLLREYLILHRKCKSISVTGLHTVFEDLVGFLLDLTGVSAVRSNSSLDEAKRLLEDVVSTQSLEEIAEECGISYHTFRKQFTSAFGMSPGRYRTLSKIEAAKNELYSGASVKAMADKLGFSDIYSFSHCFKSVVGIPPAQYRTQSVIDIPKSPVTVTGGALPIVYKTGTIHARDGQENPYNATRLHTPDYIPLAEAEGVTVAPGYQLSWLAYGKNRNYLGNGNNYTGLWQPEGASFRSSNILAIYPDAVYFRFGIKNVAGTTMSLYDVEKSDVTVVAAGGSLTGSAPFPVPDSAGDAAPEERQE